MKTADLKKLNRAVRKAVRGMKPPETLTVTEWAEKHRRLSTEGSAEPGAWRTSRTPYLKEPMDAFTDPKVRHIVMVAASQVGKSEFINNCIGYVIDQDPGSILFVHPTTIDAKDYSRLRIAPMIEASPTLRKKVAAPKSRDTGNTILQKTYPGGILTMCGSTEAHSLASKPIRYVFGDERDRWAVSAGKEGDPWDLAMARQTTFFNAKAVEVSTTTIHNASPIERAYYKGTMERYKSQCPHCGKYSEIQWKDIRFKHETTVTAGEKTHSVTAVWYVCPECGAVSTESEMKKAPARWEMDNPSAYEMGTRSFWLNAFVSRWAAWPDIVLKYLNAAGSTQKLQVVYNTCFGEPWEDRTGLQDEESLIGRREEYEAELPEGVLVLTCGIDTQEDRLEYEVVGHGRFGETWGIQRGIIMGRPDDTATHEQLDEILDKTFHYGDGLGLKISISFWDEGGHFTQDVRSACRSRMEKHLFAIKGMHGPDRPFTAPPKKMNILMKGQVIGSCWQYQIGVDAGKQIIMDNLAVQRPGSRYCHFPKRDDYGPAYFQSLVSERLVYKDGRQQPWQWEVIPGHERNESLDCRNYALAAFRALPGLDLDAVARRLIAARAQKVSGKVVTTLDEPKPKKQAAQRPQRKNIQHDRYYDDW